MTPPLPASVATAQDDDDDNDSGQCAACGGAITDPDWLGTWSCPRCVRAMDDELDDDEDDGMPCGFDADEEYDPPDDPNICPECGGDMTFVREGVYCCTNTNDCDYCVDCTADNLFADEDDPYDDPAHPDGEPRGAMGWPS